MTISITKLTKLITNEQFGPVDLTVAEGQTTALIGPSGCGKSTLLRLIIGLLSPTSGSILLNDLLVSPQTLPHIRKRVGYAIQEGGLFPHLTAYANISLAARNLKKPAAAIRERIAFLAELMQLPLEMLNLYPLQLSGGERQRVSLMRALMLDPDYLLLDEPLAALDPMTRFELQKQLKKIFGMLKKTVLWVTHDMQEADYLGKEAVLMRTGKIVQKGTFKEMLARPADPFVTTYIQAQTYPI